MVPNYAEVVLRLGFGRGYECKKRSEEKNKGHAALSIAARTKKLELFCNC